ncbi:MAG: peptide deformylase [Candidatus Magasanikbacteria bacterium CG11_big_fil_rev_8_21_14_0_20_39_34]|uniref:Peptide deformylase n=1 Tax=Candidatus Magasanikbacteria bacterium CG11_big_fil_rev_8_21_14_0_20_39_34 TaxID=1974653 RepID=A0A2H0N5I5_9BACT|nr:MAG: peptide deformylase [Candidatus Magasanikbacteria bacterium CG11_big_fil_rev_8_21_14_0_20_39_34]
MLDIITVPTPSLRKRSKEIDHNFLVLEETQQFIDDMVTTMYEDDGIGLAAPQVAQNIRICVIGKEAIPKKHHIKGDLILVNPTWERISKKTLWDIEGCLSVPRIFGKVKRYKEIEIKAWDRNGKPLSFEANDFLARVIQHEVDHLDGVLFIDKARDLYEVERKDSRL